MNSTEYHQGVYDALSALVMYLGPSYFARQDRIDTGLIVLINNARKALEGKL